MGVKPKRVTQAVVTWRPKSMTAIPGSRHTIQSKDTSARCIGYNTDRGQKFTWNLAPYFGERPQPFISGEQHLLDLRTLQQPQPDEVV